MTLFFSFSFEIFFSFLQVDISSIGCINDEIIRGQVIFHGTDHRCSLFDSKNEFEM